MINRSYLAKTKGGTMARVNVFEYNLRAFLDAQKPEVKAMEDYIQLEDGAWIKPRNLMVCFGSAA